ncbi:MAG TPA: aldo/keto reductase [Burkholderiales bacterium]|nr:aldo/keto reductase [Burkholderiales bacterium]
MKDLHRRQFLRRAALVAAGARFAGMRATGEAAAAVPAPDPVPVPGALPPAATGGALQRRPFGRTGAEVSLLGLGGHAIGKAGSQAEATRIVQEAVDAGVTFMDNAWEYHDGRSEEWMGAALAGRRDQVFLMTKVCTHGGDGRQAIEQLEQSLKRLRTDHLDLWQVHEVIYDNDPDLHFRPGGVVDALSEAKRQGKTRFVGFTGHKDPAIHLKMLSHDFPFDSCQLPLNAFDGSFRSFEERVLPELVRRGIAPIAMKSLGGTGEAVKQGALSVNEALRYVLSLPIATLVSGIDSLDVLQQNVAIAASFAPMSPSEMAALRQRCAQVAADGRFELYKTSKKFDGEPGRRNHGFPLQPELPA